MDSNLSSFSERFDPADFDEEVPYQHQVAIRNNSLSTEKEFDGIEAYINKNCEKRTSSRPSNAKDSAQVDSFNVPEAEKNNDETPKYRANQETEIKPFNYQKKYGTYFGTNDNNKPNVIRNNQRKDDRPLQVKEVAHSEVSKVESSYVSVPNEEYEYAVEEIEEKPTELSISPNSAAKPNTAKPSVRNQRYEIVNRKQQIANKPSSKLISKRISPLRSYRALYNENKYVRNQGSPTETQKLTANVIPSLVPSMRHLTKFDAIYHQKSPSKTVSKHQAYEIGKRLYSSKSNRGRSLERKKRNMKMLSQSLSEKQAQECTFQPDTSLTHSRNQTLYEKMKSRSQSREGKVLHFTSPQNTQHTNKLLLQGCDFKNFNTITEESENNNIPGRSFKYRDMFNSLKSSTSQQSLLKQNLLHPSQATRTFDEFYAEQMNHMKQKIENIQSKLTKKEKIMQEMQKQRERVNHLSEESRRILSNSRERKRSGEGSQLISSSKSDLKDLSMTIKNSANDFSLKNVHERLFNEK